MNLMTNICLLLSKYEKDADLEVIIPSALLHDTGRVEESEDRTGEIIHAVLGCKIAEGILENFGI
ncbi:MULTISPECIES: HD domain-containing protein [Clostridium]|uniref:HD domain-containing protein n=1 Tax=Clostridium frigoriphilum TaxID=443253 RepID=A0ABU7UJ90_9CLOT